MVPGILSKFDFSLNHFYSLIRFNLILESNDIAIFFFNIDASEDVRAYFFACSVIQSLGMTEHCLWHRKKRTKYSQTENKRNTEIEQDNRINA